MPRAFLYLLLSVPLLMPPGFCPCHLAEAAADVCAEGNDDTAPADDHDPDCPCHNIDASIRGFRSHDSVDVDGPLASPAIVATPLFVLVDAYLRPDRENVPIFPTPPRFVVFLTLVI